MTFWPAILASALAAAMADLHRQDLHLIWARSSKTSSVAPLETVMETDLATLRKYKRA